ncbi:MAG TPA: methyltransferase domain-containing protein [Vicinamibacteria bacterium]|nr:methyltransferase domain-containing protein [Vicinamibacteria bacterium]
MTTPIDPGAGRPRVESPVQEEYRRLAAGYDQRWAAYVSRTTERTLDHLHPKAGERILDVGCGTGALLRAIEEREPGADAVGVDLSLPMLRAAGAQRAGAALVVSEAGLLPLRSGTFDAVASVSSFHYWADPEGALREVARVLRPRGRIVLTDWCDDFVACRLCDRWLRLTRSAHRRIYGSGECRAIVTHAGFEVASVERYKVSWLWGMMTLVGRRD